MKKNLKETFRDAFDDALSQYWSEARNEFGENIYVELSGFERAEIQVVDGCAGETWSTKKLSQMVDDFIESKDGSCGQDEKEWMEAIAKDFEKQANKIRKAIDKWTEYKL